MVLLFMSSYEVLLLGTLLATTCFAKPVSDTEAKRPARRDNGTVFQWTDIIPSPELNYHDCFDGLQCARLQVPLDWNSTDVTDYVAIAIARLPAQVPVTDPRYGGAVLINPGGPGESGIAQVDAIGVGLQTVFDAAYVNGSTDYLSNSSSALYYDIIGFDPRGVNNTSPFLSCFSTVAEEVVWVEEGKAGLIGLQLGTPEGPLDLIWTSNEATAQNCFVGPAITPNGSRIADFLGTTSVARDIVEIVERHGQWREKQTNDTSVRQRIQYQPGEEPINFYGVSYGTLIGATVAAMQPHRVNRIMLDGVVDASEYYALNLTTDNVSVDTLMQKFFEYCALAGGPDGCALWNGNSSADTEQFLQAIYQNITSQGPIPVANNETGPTSITLSNLKTALGRAIYNPLVAMPQFAEITAPLSVGDGSGFAVFLASIYDVLPPILPEAYQTPIDPYDPSMSPDKLEQPAALSGYGIIGADTSLRTSEAQFYDVWQNLRANVSTWDGDHIATQTMIVFSWPNMAKWRFADNHPVASNVTKRPILFLNNVLDPATSLQSATNMHNAFAQSGLLVNDGEGHTTPTAPSLCVVQKMRYYMQTGQIPPGLDQPCLPYERMFLGTAGPNTAPFNPVNSTFEDRVLYNASMAIAF